MKVVYISYDGMEFEHEIDCLVHEFEISHPALDGVLFKDLNNKVFFCPSYFSDYLYTHSYYISIHSQEELEALNDLGKFNDWCLFERIDKVGKWHWDDEKEEFIYDGDI